MKSMRSSIIVSATLLVSLSAWAGPKSPPPPEEKAHYDRGVGFYNQARYREALEAFQAAYGVRSEADYLINIGHSQRRLGDHEAALVAYRSYLKARPDAPGRPECERFIADTEAEKGRKDVAPAAMPPPPPAAAPVVYAPMYPGYMPPLEAPKMRLDRAHQKRTRGISTTIAGLLLFIQGTALFGAGLARDRYDLGDGLLYAFSALSYLAGVPCVIAGPILWKRGQNEVDRVSFEMKSTTPPTALGPTLHVYF
jgi:tetratricopeptide (TPR) repeat protein